MYNIHFVYYTFFFFFLKILTMMRSTDTHKSWKKQPQISKTKILFNVSLVYQTSTEWEGQFFWNIY